MVKKHCLGREFESKTAALFILKSVEYVFRISFEKKLSKLQTSFERQAKHLSPRDSHGKFSFE